MAGMQFDDRNSFMGAAGSGRDIVPHATNLNQTRAIMVSTDGTTITGILEKDTTAHTTFPLLAGVMYIFAFKTITAVTGGTAKGYL